MPTPPVPIDEYEETVQEMQDAFATSNYALSSLFGKLQARGVNPFRPEILAVVEFLPLALNNEDASTDYSSIEFGAPNPVSEATRAAKLAEVNRMLSVANMSNINNLVSKESGMTFELIRLITDYYNKVLISILDSSNAQYSEIQDAKSDLFSTGTNLSLGAKKLAHYAATAETFRNLQLTVDSLGTALSGEGVESGKYFVQNPQTIANKLDFGESGATISLIEFLNNNINHARLILLARCVLIQHIAEGIIKFSKSSADNIQQIVDAISLAKIIDMSAYATEFNNYFSANTNTIALIEDQAASINSEEPLKSIGLSISGTEPIANTDIFVNIVASLVSELLFTADTVKYTPGNEIILNDNNNFGAGVFYEQDSESNNTINDEIAQNINFGKLISEKYDNNNNAYAQKIAENPDDFFNFVLYNEVVADHLLHKATNNAGYDVLNFGNVTNSISGDVPLSTRLQEYFEKVFFPTLNIEALRNSSVFKLEINNLGKLLLEENSYDPPRPYSSPGNSYGAYIDSIMNLKKPLNTDGTEAPGRYIAIESAVGLQHSNVDMSLANEVIPAEDAMINNPLSNASSTAEVETHIERLEEDSKKMTQFSLNLAEDICHLYGLAYDNDRIEGTYLDAMTNSRANGKFAINYLNYYLEGVANFLQTIITAAYEKEFDLVDYPEHANSLYTLFFMLNTSPSDPESYDQLFRSFYFNRNLWEEDSFHEFDPITKKEYLGTPASNDTAAEKYQLSELGMVISQRSMSYNFMKLFCEGFGISIEDIFPNANNPEYAFFSAAFNMNVAELKGVPIDEGFVIGASEPLSVEFDNVFDTSSVENPTILTDFTKKSVLSQGDNPLHDYFGHIFESANSFPVYSCGIEPDDSTGEVCAATELFRRIIAIPPGLAATSGIVAAGKPESGIFHGGRTTQTYLEGQSASSSPRRPLHVHAWEHDSSSGYNEYDTESNIGVTGGFSQMTNFQKSYITFIWCTEFIRNNIGAHILQQVNDASTRPGLRAILNHAQFYGVIDAIRSTKDESRYYGDPTVDFLTGDVAIETYNAAYDKALEYIGGIKNKIVQKKERILTHLKLLIQPGKELFGALKEIEQQFIDEQNNPNKAYSDYVKDFIGDNSYENFILAKDMYANQINYYADHLGFSSDSFPYSTYDARANHDDAKTMYKVLTQPGYNLLENEIKGKKSILNVGVPVGLVDSLAEFAYNNSGDSGYQGSTLIAIYLHRKNELNNEEEVFPRPFVFDIAKHVISYTPFGNGVLAKSMAEPWRRNYLEDILESTYFATSDRNSPNTDSSTFLLNSLQTGISGVTGFQDPNTGAFSFNQPSIGFYDNEDFVRDVAINHLFDHYLKLYQSLILGYEFESYNFLLDNSALYTGNADNDPTVKTIREGFKLFLQSYFPSFNVDIETGLMVSNALKSYDNLIMNSAKNRVDQMLTGNIFSRVFSIPFSDKDFIINMEDITDAYDGTDLKDVAVSVCSRSQFNDVSQNMQNYEPKDASYPKSYTNEANTIYRYFTTINILKGWGS